MELYKVFFIIMFTHLPVSPTLPTDWVVNGDSQYYFTTSKLNWDAAKTDCDSLGGQLACLEDQPERDFIENIIHDEGVASWWTCINDLAVEGEYIWLDAGSATNPDWFGGVPNPAGHNAQPNGAADQNCIHIRRKFSINIFQSYTSDHYYWNDAVCSETSAYICEAPVITTGTVAGVAVTSQPTVPPAAVSTIAAVGGTSAAIVATNAAVVATSAAVVGTSAAVVAPNETQGTETVNTVPLATQPTGTETVNTVPLATQPTGTQLVTSLTPDADPTGTETVNTEPVAQTTVAEPANTSPEAAHTTVALPSYTLPAEQPTGVTPARFTLPAVLPTGLPALTPPPAKDILGWSTWTEWTECDKNCGGGKQMRLKMCKYGSDMTCMIPMYSDGYCQVGYTPQFKICNMIDCYAWATWQEWEGCSTSCGIGIIKRRHECIPAAEGTPTCLGTPHEMQICELPACVVDAAKQRLRLQKADVMFKTSDSRPSAVTVGLFGVVCMVVIMIVFLMIDAPTIWRDAKTAKKILSQACKSTK